MEDASTKLTEDLRAEEEVVQQADPLNLTIKDEKLVEIIDKSISDSRKYFRTEYNLYERRKINEKYVFGKQIAEQEDNEELKPYEARYLDNALYEIEASIKPLGMSRLPDLIVTPGSPGSDIEAKQQTADDITTVVDSDIKKRQNRVALGIAFKHLPVYFTGIIKVRWCPEDNDFIFEVVHPDYIDVDHTCQTNSADDMRWIRQILPITVQNAFIRFPKNKAKFIEELEKEGIKPNDKGEFSQKDLATTIKISEVWFDWEKPKPKKVEPLETDETPPANEEEEKDIPDDYNDYELVHGVMWKYGKCVLEKMKNPNYDWEGKDSYVVYDDPADASTKRPISEEEFIQAMTTGVTPYGMTKEQTFHNYFDRPRKPYFFMGYDQWRKMPYDETSRIEQNIHNQENLDTTGKRVIEKLKKRTKHVISKESGITADQLEELDLDDDEQDLLVEGDVNKVHAAITPEQVTPQEFKSLDETRQRMYSLAGATAVRGELQSDVATTNQIAREADYTRADDLVEDTINAACEWMGQWSLQMIKLRYNENHFRKMLGAQGAVTFVKLQSDMIEDGMEVMIKASGTDKLKTKNQAMDMAKIGVIDPYNLFRDIGADDPKGRTEALLLFQTNPAAYLAKYGMALGGNPAELGVSLNGQPATAPAAGQNGIQQTQPLDLSNANGQPSPQNAQVPELSATTPGTPRII